MLLDNGDGTFTAGPLDVICILKDMQTGRFHPAFFEEKPLPGLIENVNETTVVRLKSKMHHTSGFATLEDAQKNIAKDLSVKIKVPEKNICNDAIDWDGEIGITWICSNWVKSAETFGEKHIAM